MGADKVLLPIFVVYALGCIFTIGAFYRDRERSIGVKQIICTLIWPIWWPVANGFGPMLDAIDNAVTATDGRKSISFALGLFAAGHCLSSSWGDCGGAVACSGVLLKSTAMFFPPLNFVYVTWLVTQFA
ncbi:hypothetical protein V5279_28805 [Bradyrhizobium sp. 26S5]|jgi:hypothetical protein|uniref:hypothetical protein n=1 Tax=unclassified Bradyrhizobium TaxID=2631580 RepID=UPI001595C99F